MWELEIPLEWTGGGGIIPPPLLWNGGGIIPLIISILKKCNRTGSNNYSGIIFLHTSIQIFMIYPSD